MDGGGAEEVVIGVSGSDSGGDDGCDASVSSESVLAEASEVSVSAEDSVLADASMPPGIVEVNALRRVEALTSVIALELCVSASGSLVGMF